MSQEIKFIDPAFACEVSLKYTAKLLYEAAKPEFERLKEIRNLGIIASLSDTGLHVKHDHLVGLMRLFVKLCQQPLGYGLPKKFLWSFWCRLCFAQTGHAAFAYDAEKAVLLASHIDTGFREKFRDFVKPAMNQVAACEVCKNDCKFRGENKGKANLWFDQMVDKFEWKQVHCWVAAVKLSKNEKVMSILEETNKKKSKNHFSKTEAYKMLLCSECEWNRVIKKINRLDYVVRDLAFTGTVGIQLDVDGLVAAANQEHPDWELVRMLDNYLINTLYAKINTQTQSALFQRTMAAALIDKKVSLKELFGIEPTHALTDEKLQRILCQRKSGREIFDRNIQSCWKTWVINTKMDNSKSPYNVEKEITGIEKGYLTEPTYQRTFIHKLIQPDVLGFALYHDEENQRPTARAFIKAFRSILKKQYPLIIMEEITTAMCEGLFGRVTTHGLEKAISRFGDMSSQVEPNLKQVSAIIKNKAAGQKSEEGIIRIKVGEIDYPLNIGLVANLMHACLYSKENREKLDIKVENAGKFIWDQLLRWQSIYFGLNPAVSVLALVNATQKILFDNIMSGMESRQGDLEYYTLLEALKHPNEGVSYRVTLPNLVIYKEDGNQENEYDIVSFILKKDKNVEVWIWGVTIQKHISAKRKDDYNKINRLKDLLARRWGDDVRVICNYICKEQDRIRLDVDGVQSTRT